MDNVRFPTGKFEYSEPSSGKEMDRWIERLEQLPGKLQEEVAGMTDTRLAALYAWHGDHHLAHITNLKERHNW